MKMTFRWYGNDDSITLDYIRQIPCMTGVVTAVYSVPVGEVWPQEEIDAMKATVNAKGLEMEELMDEIEGIVMSGTKLNLDYYIEQTLDEDVIEEIYDYFMEEAESDSLVDAMKDLSSDYDEMEVRLVRVKFLCEVAN